MMHFRPISDQNNLDEGYNTHYVRGYLSWGQVTVVDTVL